VRLSDLLKTIAVKHISGTPGSVTDKCSDGAGNLELEIGSIHYRAQDVEPGGLFVAISGLAADGHDYIDEALNRGAAAVIAEKPVQKEAQIITVANSRKALAMLAARFYGNPAQDLCVVGITGTNGKTTTAYLCESILQRAGFNVGVIGTINYRYGGHTFTNPVTTPESLDLHRILAEMKTAGVTHVVLEVSSHAMALFRVTHCWLDVGVFTNLSQDHLDFHGDINTYWLCKQRMFTDHLVTGPKNKQACAVINGEDTRGKQLSLELSVPCITYGTTAEHSIWTEPTHQDLHGSEGTIHTPSGEFHFTSSLVGAHNVENILGATGVGLTLNLSLETIEEGIERVRTIPGRLERIPNPMERFVFVDYAHTPDALENVLRALKSVQHARIICIFGCGGDRDQEKRPLMGEIAGRRSDLAIITSDNPRTESPDKIIRQIREGVLRTAPHAFTAVDLLAGFQSKGHVVEPNRRKAIALGISVSQPGDTILIAGKGHETYQIIGKTTFPFDDRREAEKTLNALWDASTTVANSA
jgi:UDP-N-acetylmuramoyl-L-alanyl-D-glutamate--2,6-diaminopimelate ligase/murE/murF fusion protein